MTATSAQTLPLKSASPGALIWRRLRRHRLAMLGGIILIALYSVALFAGFFAPYSYERQDRDRFFHPPTIPHLDGFHLVVPRYVPVEGKDFVYRAVMGDTKPVRFFVSGEKYSFLWVLPTTIHLFGTGEENYPIYLFGTDQFGRDVFSRLVYGSQISLSMGVVGIALSFAIGVWVGAIAGYFGGFKDTVIMRFCELVMSVPALYLIIAMRAMFPPKMSSAQVYGIIIVILSFIGWASTARVIRGMVLSLRERQYVLAARALGQSEFMIIARHVIPGTFSYLIVAATLNVPYYILGEVVLSFLSVGIQEPTASWGNMLEAARNTEYLRQYPWFLAPGAAIFITVLAFNFLGDGVIDAVDAKS